MKKYYPELCRRIICIFLIIINTLLVIGNWSLVIADEYRLAPCDQLEVRILGQKDLDTKQSIAPDGTISLPFLGRIPASGKTLSEFEQELKTSFSKYIQKPQIIVYLTSRPIYVIQHDIKKNVWEVKEAKSVEEAKAYLGGQNFSFINKSVVFGLQSPVPSEAVSLSNRRVEGSVISHGDIVSVDVSKKADFFEDNWQKVITATAVVVGIYTTLHK